MNMGELLLGVLIALALVAYTALAVGLGARADRQEREWRHAMDDMYDDSDEAGA